MQMLSDKQSKEVTKVQYTIDSNEKADSKAIAEVLAKLNKKKG